MTRLTDHARGATTVGLLVSTALFLGAGVIAARAHPPQWELDSFRAINDLPGWIHPPVWVAMQYGALVAVPVAALGAWLLRWRREAIGIAVSGLAGYLMAKVIKQIVERERPVAFLDDVTELEDFGAASLGFPSGHAVVAAAITTVCFARLSPPWRAAAVVLTAAVMFGRVYNGGHLALDVIGGAALGVAFASVALLVIGNTRDEDRRLTDAR